MREIKFRAWNKIFNGMATWEMIKLECDRFSFLENKDWEFMQYTGLKDKKGKEIYEGDIMRGTHCEYIDGVRHDNYPDKEPSGVVFFGEVSIDTGNQGHGMGNGSRTLYAWYVNDYSKSNPKDLTIIGNIYENPELLEKSQ